MKGKLRLLALKYLKEEENLSGTEITNRVKQGTGWEPSPGTIYPLLEKLEQKELVVSEKQGRKRKFQITEKGEETFQNFQKEQEKYWGQIIQSLRNYQEIFDKNELEEFIQVLEKAKKGNYETSYPIMIGYRIIDKLHTFDNQSTEKHEKISKILEETLEQIEEELE